MLRSRRWLSTVFIAMLAGTGVANANPIAIEEPEPVHRGVGMGHVPLPTSVSAGNWRLLLDPADPVDTLPPPPQTSPIAARILHTAIFDAANQRMVVSGGLNSSTAYSDVWTMDLSGPAHTWAHLTTVGSMGPRRDHTSIYDPVRQRMVSFGGTYDFSTMLNDTWQLTLGATPTWTQVPTNGTPPPGRIAHTAIYDPVRDRMIVFGGYTSAFVNDTWQLDFTTSPATWSPIAVGTAPAPRNAMTGAYDPIGDRMIVFGGFGNGTFKGDLWALSLSGTPAWTQLAPTGSLPAARRHYAAAVDPTRNRLLISGGLHFAPDGVNTQNLGTTYQLSFSTLTWSQIPVTGPTPRSAHRGVYSPQLDEFVIFGGYDDSGYRNDAWRLVNPASPAWQQITGSTPTSAAAIRPAAARRVSTTTEVAPTARRDHTAVIDNDDHMVIFGGWDGENNLNDVWKLGLSGAPVWSPVATVGTPPSGRIAHTSLWDPNNNRMLVFGGYDGNFLNDLWQLSFAGTPTWSRIVPGGTPPTVRDAMTAVYDAPRRRFVVFGGWSGTEFLDDVWALNLDGPPVWSNITPAHGLTPSPRRHYAAIYNPVDDRMVISGGFDYTYREDSWEFDFEKNQWFRLNVGRDNAPERNSHRGVLDAARNVIVIFGGYGGNSEVPFYLNDSWQLDLNGPGHPSWNVLLPTGVLPTPRLLHTCVFDAAHDRMLMFGGLDGAKELDDLWALEFSPPAPILRTPDRGASRGIPQAVAFALHGSYPNPSSGPFHVDFSLPESESATLGIYAVNGRRVAVREVGSLGRGRHRVEFTERFAPGIYWIRLNQAGSTRTMKTAIMK